MPVRLQKVSTSVHDAVPSRLAAWTAVSAATLCLFAVSAQANEAEAAVPKRIVNYADLNPTHSADARVLYLRLERASNAVCRPLEGASVQQVRQYQNCYDEALSNAVASVDHANVTALYRSDSGNVRVAQRADSRRRI